MKLKLLIISIAALVFGACVRAPEPGGTTGGESGPIKIGFAMATLEEELIARN
jgi:hypothetical protein